MCVRGRACLCACPTGPVAVIACSTSQDGRLKRRDGRSGALLLSKEEEKQRSALLGDATEDSSGKLLPEPEGVPLLDARVAETNVAFSCYLGAATVVGDHVPAGLAGKPKPPSQQRPAGEPLRLLCAVAPHNHGARLTLLDAATGEILRATEIPGAVRHPPPCIYPGCP